MGRSGSKKDDGSSSNSNVQIPSEAKKIIQRLREILNNKSCTDSEIYSVLKDSNMNPDEAVHRLLQLDTFHEVKSKRERRKEMKETRELKTPVNNSTASSAVKVSEEYNVGHASSSSHTNYNDYGRAMYKKDNGLAGLIPSSSLVYRIKTSNEQPSPQSDHLKIDSTRQTSEIGNGVSLSGQPHAADHVTWNKGTSNSGRMTMADIVRAGKPRSRDSQTAAKTTHVPQDSNSQFSSFSHLKPSYDSSSSQMGMQKDQQSADSANESRVIHESFIASTEHSFSNDWPSFDQQTSASGSSILNDFTNEWLQNSYDGTKFPERVDGDDATENATLTSASPSVEVLDAAEGPYKILGRKVIPNYIHQGGISNSSSAPANSTASLDDKVSSTAVDFHKPILGKEEPGMPISEDNSAVVFPDNMQAVAADLSHLSFGTYNSGVSTTVSGSLTSDSLKNNLEGLRSDSVSTAAYDARNSWYADQILRGRQVGLKTDTKDYAYPLFSQSESRRSIPQVPNSYEFVPSSMPDSNYRNMEDFRSVVTNKIARNPPLQRELQSSSVPVSNDFLAFAVQSLRDSDHAYSPFLGLQSASLKYSGAVPSSVDPTTMSEALNSSAFSLPASYTLALPGVSLAVGSALPQRATALPQSALHHSYHDIGVFHDFPAAINRSVPQFEVGAFRSSLPPSGFGGIQSQYNEDTSLTMLQQAPNIQSSPWDYVSSRRAVPTVLDGRGHSLPAQNQLHSRDPQSQQLMRNYDALGLSSLRHSQAGTIGDQQQSASTQAQSSDQFWQQRFRR